MKRFIGILIAVGCVICISAQNRVERIREEMLAPNRTSVLVVAHRADGVYLGQGQATAHLSKGESHAITATKGNRTACAAINYSISTTGILDAVGGCLLLLPAVGLASDGAWKLDATHIYLKMP